MNTQPTETASTIDEVIRQLEQIVGASIATRSRQGFFAALYLKVTAKVRDGIASGYFEDGPRMERLDVVFANRYLTALEQFRNGKCSTRCWNLAFEVAAKRQPIILQHLLLGMNAHINFDLGSAAAQTSPGSELASLKRDFDQLNQILEDLVSDVIAEINQLSPWINLLARVDPRSNIAVINFSIEKARAYAWNLAELLASQSPDDLGPTLAIADEFTTGLGQLIASPIGIIFNTGLQIIRARESGNVPRIIQTLSSR